MDSSLPGDQLVLSIGELEAQITELAGHLNVTEWR